MLKVQLTLVKVMELENNIATQGSGKKFLLEVNIQLKWGRGKREG